MSPHSWSAALSVLAVMCMAAGEPAVSRTPPASGVRWSATAAGFLVALTPDDIRASRKGTAVFSARRAARQDFDALAQDSEAAAVRIQRKLTVVSLAGPFLSIRDESYVEVQPAAHPGGETRFWTIDLRRPSRAGAAVEADGLNAIGAGRAVDLAALVGAATLVKVLAADPVVKRNGAPAPATLDEVRDALEASASSGGACYLVPQDWTRRFVILGLSGAKLRVHIGLPGCGANRYAVTRLGLDIPISPTLRRQLGAINQGPAGPPVSIAFDRR